MFSKSQLYIYMRQYKFTCLQKQDKLLKYKCKVNVYQEHNNNISCYKFIFNQIINCQMSKRNLLLMLSCTTIFVIVEGSVRGRSWYFRPSPRGGSENFIPIAKEGQIIFSA